MYRFTPPTRPYRVTEMSTDRLWGRVTNDTGVAVVLYDDGRVVTAQVAPSSSEDGVVKAWPGGRTYDVTDAEADILSAAGYSANLVEVV